MERILDTGRAQYNKKKKKKKNICTFCDASQIGDQECKSLEGKYWKVVVNIYPYMDGNVMIIPRRHVTKISELDDKEWKEFRRVIIKTKKRLSEIFETDSFNIGINIGEQSGRSISHLHWQVIPRRITNYTAMNVLANIYVITLSPSELREIIDKKEKKKDN